MYVRFVVVLVFIGAMNRSLPCMKRRSLDEQEKDRLRAKWQMNVIIAMNYMQNGQPIPAQVMADLSLIRNTIIRSNSDLQLSQQKK